MQIVKNYKDRKLDTNKPVRVFRNLSPQYRSAPVYSVQQRVNGRWQTILHVKSINLKDAKFVVSQKGVERIRKEKKKTVVATVHGYVCDSVSVDEWSLYFNPYKLDHFIVRDTEFVGMSRPVYEAHLVSFLPNDKNFPLITVSPKF